jgi:hypothetical protein
MSTTSYIGRKVELTQEYIEMSPEYVSDGENIGIVIEDTDGLTGCWEVQMNNGTVSSPYAPEHKESQCILLEETNQEALDRLQLQPGDVVRVVGNDNGIFGWIYPMEECMGQLQEVREIDNENCMPVVGLWLPNKKKSYWYRPQILEVIERAADKQKTTEAEPTNSTAAGHTILDTAKGLIYGDRLKDYGKTVDNFNAIAVGWTEIAKTPLTPEQVGLMMIWLKVCRANNDNCEKEDSIIDIVGYAGCIEKIKKGI